MLFWVAVLLLCSMLHIRREFMPSTPDLLALCHLTKRSSPCGVLLLQWPNCRSTTLVHVMCEGHYLFLLLQVQ